MTPLDYARRGWSVFPVEGKQPLTDNGFHDATTDPAQIAIWTRRWPRARIGVATGKPSGIVVFDIDTKNPRENGYDTLEDLGRSILPETPMAHTPSGGLHIYFATIEREIRNSVGKHGLGPGLDVRGDGGYIIVPSGGSGYTWDPRYNLNTVPLLPAPAWLGHRQRLAASGSARDSRLSPQGILAMACDNIRSAVNGERHDVLNREAFIVGTLVAAGALPERAAWHELEAATAAMAWGTRGDQRKAANDLVGAFNDGLARPRRGAHG